MRSTRFLCVLLGTAVTVCSVAGYAADTNSLVVINQQIVIEDQTEDHEGIVQPRASIVAMSFAETTIPNGITMIATDKAIEQLVVISAMRQVNPVGKPRRPMGDMM